MAALVVIFVLPLPWGHTHQAFANSPTSVYQSHLSLFHAGNSDTDPCDDDWHLHWKICGAQGPACRCCQTDVVPQSVAFDVSPLSSFAVAPRGFFDVAAEGQATRPVSSQAAIPGTLTNPRSLLYRLCVLRL